MKLVINEAQADYIAKKINEEVYQMPVPKTANKPYCINPDKVLLVKKFLDKTFTPCVYEKIGEDGFPTKIQIVKMNASNGEELKTMFLDQLLDLLIDKFQGMFSDKEERELFLRQVIKDWLGKRIGIFGTLSVNSLNEVTSKDVAEEAKNADTNATEKQFKAGNYKKGHLTIKGMKIAIENAKGSKRYYRDPKTGEKKYNILRDHYGYFNVTKGKDGDGVDVFIGPDIENVETIYCVDQKNRKGEFDETKVMLGFKSKDAAKEAYFSNYSPDWKGFMYITAVSIPVFKKWLYRGRKQRIPFAKYVEIKKKRLDEWGRHVAQIYRDDDKIELVKDTNVINGGNFPIKRNGKEYWVSRSNVISLYVFCKDKNGVWNILASKRGPKVKICPNKWNVVCGFLDYGYTLEDTAVKECFEETGVRINKKDLINCGTSSDKLYGPVSTRFVCILKGVTNNYPTTTSNCEPGEVTEARWLPINSVGNYVWMGKQAEHIISTSKKFLNRFDKKYALSNRLEQLLNDKKINNKQYQMILNAINSEEDEKDS